MNQMLEGKKPTELSFSTIYSDFTTCGCSSKNLSFSRSVVSCSLQPMDWSMPGFPVRHRLPEFAQTHVHWVGHEWCHPTISSSVALFSSWVQSFPASGSFPMSWLFTSGGQNTGASASVFPVYIQGWFPLVLTGLKSLQSKQLSRVFSSTTAYRAFIVWRVS